jgi:hypothetical protein
MAACSISGIQNKLTAVTAPNKLGSLPDAVLFEFKTFFSIYSRFTL